MPSLLTRSATPDAYARTLRTRCPQCTHVLVRDDYGTWCQQCLWCGTCAGKGCTLCPHPDEYRGAATPPAPLRACETCQQSPRLGTCPQCARCLRLGVPPAEVVPLVGTTASVVREKRLQWLRVHPGWSLSPNRDYVLRLPGTKDHPAGTHLLVVEYRVERGSTSIV